jgi:multidrug resistance efflux pump
MQVQSIGIQKRLQKIRRRIIILSLVTLSGIGGLLFFIPIDEKVHASGVVRAERETYVRASIDGILAEIPVHVTEEVKAGAILARFDATDAKESLRKIEAQIDQAKAELALRTQKLETVLKQPLPKEFLHTQEDLEIAKKKKEQSEIDYQRIASLGENGAVSKHFIENARLEAELLNVEFQKAEKKVEIIEKGLEKTIVDEARAEVLTAKKNLGIMEVERASLQEVLSRHEIRAPEDSVVTLILKRTPGERAAKGDDLFHLAHGSGRLVKVFATEREYHRIKTGQKVLMTSPAFDRYRYGYIEGTVVATAIESEPQESGGEKRVYRVHVRVDQTPQPLMLGSSVEADIVLRRTPIWRLLLPVRE